MNGTLVIVNKTFLVYESISCIAQFKLLSEDAVLFNDNTKMFLISFRFILILFPFHYRNEGFLLQA